MRLLQSVIALLSLVAVASAASAACNETMTVRQYTDNCDCQTSAGINTNGTKPEENKANELRCGCRDKMGNYVDTKFDLNSCVANVGSKLKFKKDGVFQKTCYGIHYIAQDVIAKGPVLKAMCESSSSSGKYSMTTLKLNDTDGFTSVGFKNDNGKLKCVAPDKIPNSGLDGDATATQRRRMMPTAAPNGTLLV